MRGRIALPLLFVPFLIAIGAIFTPDFLAPYVYALIPASVLAVSPALALADWRKVRGERIPNQSSALLASSLSYLLFMPTLIGIELIALGVITGIIPVSRLIIDGAQLYPIIPLAATVLLAIGPMIQIWNPSGREKTTRRVIPVVILFTFSALLLLWYLLAELVIAQESSLAILQEGHLLHLVGLSLILAMMGSWNLQNVPSPMYWMRAKREEVKRAHGPMVVSLQSQALRIYILATVFTLGAVGFVAAVVANRLPINATTGPVILVLFAALSLMMFFWVFLGFIQSKKKHREPSADSEMQAWVESVLKRRKDPVRVRNQMVFGFFGFLSFLALLVMVAFIANLLPWSRYYFADALMAATVLFLIPVTYLEVQRRKNEEAWERSWPDFLRDVSEMARAGMTLPRALVQASSGEYGTLTPNLDRLSIQVQWGIPFDEALLRFAKRTKTRLIARSVGLINEAQRAGGDVVEVLRAAADDASSLQRIMDERRENMKLYGIVVWIAFFVFLVIVSVLNWQFIPAFEDVAKQSEGNSIGSLIGDGFDARAIKELFYHGAAIQALTGGLVSGVLVTGRPSSGARSSILMIIIGMLVFRVGEMLI